MFVKIPELAYSPRTKLMAAWLSSLAEPDSHTVWLRESTGMTGQVTREHVESVT